MSKERLEDPEEFVTRCFNDWTTRNLNCASFQSLKDFLIGQVGVRDRILTSSRSDKVGGTD